MLLTDLFLNKKYEFHSLFFIVIFFLSLWSQANNWSDHKVSLVAKQARFRQAESKIFDLIVEKRKTKSQSRKREIIDEIKSQYVELNKAFEIYNEEQQHVRFEHPDKDDQESRHYVPLRLQSLSELEDSVGLDGQLSRVQGKMRKVYDVKENEKEKVKKVEKKIDKQEKLKLSY